MRTWRKAVAAAITITVAMGLGAVPASAAAQAFGGRRVVDLAEGWRFALVNPAGITDPTGEYANAHAPGFDDSGWRAVDVPHDWSIELLPTAGPGTSSGTGFFQGGLGWYRKAFTLARSTTGKRVSVEFDGVYMDSFVYLNGRLLGRHPYGYTGFSFDLTDGVHTDGRTPNVLAVKVQNQLPSSRWYSGSGIYRNVRLTVTDPVHIRRWGTFVTTPDLAASLPSGHATVRVRTELANETGAPVGARIVHKVRDAGGRTVATASVEVVAAPDTRTDTTDIRLERPRLWSFDDPYLYTVETKVIVGRETADTYTTRFGVRHMRIDPADGLFLNGLPAKIQGVDLHHDLGALGAATNRDALLRQMNIMKSMGVNALRTAHNPPSPELVAVCEELGIVMMVEAFDTWSSAKTTYDYARFFNEHGVADITEMVHAAKNSPAVIMWSIGNEIRGQNLATAQQLVDAVKAVDTTRPVVWGHDGYRSVPRDGSVNDQIARILDGVGLNYNTAASVDGLHAKYPDKFFFESESSSSTSARGVYQEPDRLNTGENYTPGRRGTSSYDNNMASWTMPGEYGLKKDRDRRFFTGQFLWSGFDYIGEPTPYDVFPVKSAFFGAVDTAGFAKDLYHLFKSQWTTQPMVHLLPMNWTDYRPGEEVQVWAYSNVDTVELFLNGQSLGVRTFDRKTTTYGRPYLETTEPTFDDRTVTGGPFPGSYTSPNGTAGKLHLTWRVPFAPGTLTAVARREGAEVARDELRTAGAPHALRLTPDRKVLAADGKSLSFVTVEVVDAHGVVVPGADNLVNFSVAGQGRLAGVDNGRQESAEGYQVPHRTTNHGKALAIVRSTKDSGPVTLRATAAGLAPATTTLYTTRTHGHQPLYVEPVHVRTPQGVTPTLPATVQLVYADGTAESRHVRWPGGQVDGTRLRASAVVTTYAVASLDPHTTVVPVGTPAALPATVRLTYTDGVEAFPAVTWDPVDPERYAAPGQFTVSGTVAGIQRRAQATVRVTDTFTPDTNIAHAGAAAAPSADAGYSGRPDTLPAELIDGDTATGGWSNAFRKNATALLFTEDRARAGDWVGVRWPAQQRFDTIKAYFTLSAVHARPAQIQVSYWDGRTFTPVRNLTINWADTSNTTTDITFDPVATTEIRLELVSGLPGQPNGHIQIAELEVIGAELR